LKQGLRGHGLRCLEVREENVMRNVKLNSDALALVRDDDLHLIIGELDQICVDLRDLEAASVLSDEPTIREQLHRFGKITRAAADLLAHVREESHR
jgi:hypothetical protein